MMKPSTSKPPSRVGKVAINHWTSEARRAALKSFAATHGTTVDALMDQALDNLFRARGITELRSVPSKSDPRQLELSAAPTPAPAPLPITTIESRRGLVARVRKGDLDRITAYLPVALGDQLRMRCAVLRVDLSEAIADAVQTWLDKNRAPVPPPRGRQRNR